MGIGVTFSSSHKEKALFVFVFGAGFISLLTFAPFKLWWLIPILLALILNITQNISIIKSFFIGCLFGCGTFFAEAWIAKPALLEIYSESARSFILTLIAVWVYVPIYYGIGCALFVFLRTRQTIFNSILLWPACWVISEYLRSHLFGGFPFLLLGTPTIDSPLKFLIPWLGPLGMTFVLVSFSGVLLLLWQRKNKLSIIAALLWLVLWLALDALALSQKMVTPVGNKISVALVQGNIDYRFINTENDSLFKYLTMSSPLFQEHIPLIIWPESAILQDIEQLKIISNLYNKLGKEMHSSLLLGTKSLDHAKKYSAAILLGQYRGEYLKMHLMAFADYGRGLGTQNSTPILSRGVVTQPLMQLGSHKFTVMICYDILYGDAVRRHLTQSEWLTVLADDNDFKGGEEPWQHLQIARFFALAAGRELLMATDDAVTAHIDEQGNIQAQLPLYQADILRTYVQPYRGLTFWGAVGDKPIIFLIIIILAIALGWRLKIASLLPRSFDS